MAEESITQESKMELMMQGHEIWQEKSKTEGEDVEFGVVYGQNMRQDGIADAKRLKAFNYHPDGSKSDLAVIPDEKRHPLR